MVLSITGTFETAPAARSTQSTIKNALTDVANQLERNTPKLPSQNFSYQSEDKEENLQCSEDLTNQMEEDSHSSRDASL